MLQKAPVNRGERNRERDGAWQPDAQTGSTWQRAARRRNEPLTFLSAPRLLAHVVIILMHGASRGPLLVSAISCCYFDCTRCARKYQSQADT